MNQPPKQSRTPTNKILELKAKQLTEEYNFFLDGCKIYLSGFTEQEERQLMQLITKGGGSRFTMADGSITHFVIDHINDNSVRPLLSLANSPKIVSSKWLRDCSQQNRMLNSDSYLVTIPQCYLTPSEIIPIPTTTKKSGTGVDKVSNHLEKGISEGSYTASQKMDDVASQVFSLASAAHIIKEKCHSEFSLEYFQCRDNRGL
jgi:hypothetical protein